MILTLLERLERAGGLDPRPVRDPRRWYARGSSSQDGASPKDTPPIGTLSRNPSSVGISSSGRRGAAMRLLADRTDDGVLVAPASRAASASEERIVWVGDVDILRVSPPSATPAFEPLRPADLHVRTHGLGVELRWECASEDSRQWAIRMTLPCRPAGEITFVNDEIDQDVWSTATRAGQCAARMRPYRALPEIELSADAADVTFRVDAHWTHGLAVYDADGEEQFEDRFCPGTFLVESRPGVHDVIVRIRVVPGTESTEALDAGSAIREPRKGALGRLLQKSGGPQAGQTVSPTLAPDESTLQDSARGETSFERLRMRALMLPGEFAATQGTKSAAARVPVRSLLVDAAPAVGAGALDVALWSARAAFLLDPAPVEDPTAVTLAFLRGLLSRVEVADPVGCLRGLRRWDQPLAGLNEEGPADIAVEHVALLHQAATHAFDLAHLAGERTLERRARRIARALRSWFQDNLWLRGPQRSADSCANGKPALPLRASMVLAASFAGAPLDRGQRRAIVRAAEKQLVTPGYGLLSLDSHDVEFAPTRLAGGAAWPWLLGPLIEASLLAFGPERGRTRALAALLDLSDLHGAPMAWAWSNSGAGRPVRALGPLHWPLNLTESARARALLAAAPYQPPAPTLSIPIPR